MGFYDEEKTALQYIAMADGYDGRDLVEVLKLHLPSKASVLEIGMGSGIDLDLLKMHFEATGSDLIQLDAVELDTERVFDCVYSN